MDMAAKNTNAGRTRFKFWKIPSHARLRLEIFKRDNFQCVRCGATALNIPSDYNGSKSLQCQKSKTGKSQNNILVIDHILSLANGGDNSPENLQTLCDSCNAKKAVNEDLLAE